MKKYDNVYIDRGDHVCIEVREGPTLKGEILIDHGDVEKVYGSTWLVSVHGYASAAKWKIGRFYMHRLLLDPPKKMVVDHINHDTLDNRRANIRVVKPSLNLYNRKRGNVRKVGGRYYVYFKVDGKQKGFGGFDSHDEADQRALELRRGFAALGGE